MLLKSVSMFGFKTFAESTTLNFERGITGIVGPNGSGKSNLVEAIRWVLGEQSSKSLRSSRMDDVIFAGNATRKPLGMAEVSLTFENNAGKLPIEYREVQLTRRAYRAGEIEYYINRNQVRLRDVLDLLYGTGLGPGSYAIVSQGQIDAILSSKPTERRELFEETSGITRFLVKKRESMRRLEQTEQNAIRIADLIAELERQIPELDTQVRRAKRYLKTSARLRDLEILSYVRASASRREERDRLRSALEKGDEIRAAAAAKAATLHADLAGARMQAYQKELALDEARTAAADARAELSKIEADLAAAQARLEALVQQQGATAEVRERYARERAQLQERLEAIEAQREPLVAEAERAREAEVEAHASEAQARRHVEAVFAALRELDAEHAQQAAAQAERRAQAQHARSESERLAEDARALAERAEELTIETQQKHDERARLQAALVTRQADVDGLELGLQAAAARSNAAIDAVAAAESSLRRITGEAASGEARLHTIEELEASLEGHVPGTRAAIEASNRNELVGIHGVVSNLIRVDEQYARALDVAFGAGLSNIVTATAADAERAIAFLKAQEAGRATFLPLELMNDRQGREVPANLRRPGVIDYAHRLVKTDPQYAGIVAFLVGRILVVDELPTGLALVRQHGVRDQIVTLDGDQILGGGAITGGRSKRERSILARRAQGELLREALHELRERLAAAQREAASASAEQTASNEAREHARRALAEAEMALRETKVALDTVRSEITRREEEMAGLRERVEVHMHDSRDALVRAEQLESIDAPIAGGEDRRSALEGQLASAQANANSGEARRTAATAAASSLRERVAALGAERDAAIARLAAIDRENERATAAESAEAAELEATRARVASGSETTRLLRERITATDATVDLAKSEREHHTTRATELEAQAAEAERAERDAGHAMESAKLRLAEVEGELGMLAATFAQHPATDEECADVLTRYANFEGDAIDELPRLREDLSRLANVNLNAEADRAALGERDAFLTEQRDDLMRARETLLEVIKEIEQSCQAAFNETFEAVRIAFGDVFAQLFPGGQARMWQTDPENISETGIEIAVAPPGKKMMSLAALSGGERAMTAVALIFALIRVRPSPFYLFDEIDAALDDANIGRFSDLVNECAGTAQILIVTHNKKTMELAERMYGVTMREPGVSTMISAVLSDIEPEVASVG